jgi:triacylglycerol lipase
VHKIILIIFILLSSAFSYNLIAESINESVILLHGLGDVKLSMLKLEIALKDEGYTTKNIGYSTTGETIESLAKKELSEVVERYKKIGFKKIHFVTHSMGGLIVRYYLQDHTLPTGSRIVMLSPPNHGSEIADHFLESKFYKLIVGDVGQELATNSNMLSELKPIVPEVGIIAGNKSSNKYFSKIIPGEDDGRVAVDNTKLTEMKDFIVVPSTHLTIKYNNEVIKQTAFFLKDGKFLHPKKK